MLRTGEGRHLPASEVELEAAAPSVAAIRRMGRVRSRWVVFNISVGWVRVFKNSSPTNQPPRTPTASSSSAAWTAASRRLPPECHYSYYTKEALMRMYFRQDACPLEAMRELNSCAAQGQDHAGCCRRNGITQTLAEEKCLVFCDQRAGKGDAAGPELCTVLRSVRADEGLLLAGGD